MAKSLYERVDTLEKDIETLTMAVTGLGTRVDQDHDTISSLRLRIAELEKKNEDRDF